MIKATKEFLKELDKLCDNRKQEILNAKDLINISGTVYYVSNEGNDLNDGKTPHTAWKTLERVSNANLSVNDGVLFRRGDVFRGFIKTQAGITYAAYGEGDKPKFYGWTQNLSQRELWTSVDTVCGIWKLNEPILDCGTLVFNGGEAHSRKLIPSYINDQFVCRDNEKRPFDITKELTQDLDMVCFYDDRLTVEPSKGQDFPIPLLDEYSYGELYLRCDAGNPADVFKDIEALPRRSMFYVNDNANVRIDNLCLKYIGAHAVAAGGHVVGLHVSNCEIGWIGGTVQHYFGTDPNYPQGARGSVTRYGNGVEIYGGCEDYSVSSCYIYQVYDAGITHQITTNGSTVKMLGTRYFDNLIERCVYSIEYFLEKTNGDTESYIDDCQIYGNILRFSGYGWGQQRHNVSTPAHIKGWSYENTASNFSVHHNIFDRSAYRMFHLVAKEKSSCPNMHNNVYVQDLGLCLGQYGANAEAEPEMIAFDSNVKEKIREILGDKSAKIYYI